MEHRDPVPEARSEPGHGGSGEADLGHEDDRPTAPLHDLRDGLHVDPRFPAPRDPLEEEGLGPAGPLEPRPDRIDRGPLLGGGFAFRGDLGERATSPVRVQGHLPLLEREEAPRGKRGDDSLRDPQRIAEGAPLDRRVELERRHPGAALLGRARQGLEDALAFRLARVGRRQHVEAPRRAVPGPPVLRFPRRSGRIEQPQHQAERGHVVAGHPLGQRPFRLRQHGLGVHHPLDAAESDTLGGLFGRVDREAHQPPATEPHHHARAADGHGRVLGEAICEQAVEREGQRDADQRHRGIETAAAPLSRR